MSNTYFAIPGLMDLQAPNSSALPVVLQLGSHSASDSKWVGISEIGPITQEGLPMPSAASSASLEFFSTSGSQCPAFVFSTTPVSGGGSVSLLAPASSWMFTISAQPLPLHAGLWYWVFKVQDVAGDVRSVYRGTLLVTL